MIVIRSRGSRLALAVVLVAALALTACSGRTGSDDLGIAPAPSTSAPAPETQAPSPAAPQTGCSPAATASYPPISPDSIPAGSSIETIRNNGVLRVGVSADTLLMGSRNPLTGQIEGFDIDVLHQISQAIFGTPDKLQFRVITSAQRLDVLTSGEVDIVARTMSMTCDRWTSIAFSSEYYSAGQKVLVSRDSSAKTLDDLGDKKVCAPASTTTLAKLADFPEVTAVPAATHTECLVLFQQGKVDAITGDDTILAGFVAQDPYAKVVGDAFSDEPYGLGMAADRVDLVQFVNGVLDRMRGDGTWAALYTKWLGVLGAPPAPPTADYSRPTP